MSPNKLSKNDTIGIVAPSRPIYTRKSEFEKGLKILKSYNFQTRLSKNINRIDYYSAGSPEERADDLNRMFADKNVKAIICATGGITSNQILDLVDYNLIKINPKLFIGYSDNTNLILAIYKKTELVTFYGPDVCELPEQNSETIGKYIDFLKSEKVDTKANFSIIKKGKADGKLVGGNLSAICGLLATEYFPQVDNAILFWEESGETPAKVDNYLNQLKLAGKLARISGMLIGHLDDCIDKKFTKDNKGIEKIILEVCKDYNFPIIKIDNFGHNINNFNIMPIGLNAEINTQSNYFTVRS